MKLISKRGPSLVQNMDQIKSRVFIALCETVTAEMVDYS